jgi:nicotinamidase-related amidase
VPDHPSDLIPPNASIDNTVLLVIDVINACAHQKYEDPQRRIHYTRIRSMVPSLSSFIATFQELGGEVILTTTVPWREEHLPSNINELYRVYPRAEYWSREGDVDAEQFYGLPSDGVRVVVKNSYDAFTSEALVKALEEMRAEYIIVAGVFGDGCVLATICGGFSKGYHLIIASDLIETTDDEERQALQQHLKRRMWPLMYGPTVGSSHILSTLADRCASDECEAAHSAPLVG